MDKTCDIHGDLEIDETRRQRRIRKDGSVYYSLRCRLCHREASASYATRARPGRKSYKVEWDIKNKENNQAIAREYRAANHDAIRLKKRAWCQEGRDNLEDRYIIAKIARGSGIPYEIIRKYPELIELKRDLIKIKRKTEAIIDDKKYNGIEEARTKHLREIGERED